MNRKFQFTAVIEREGDGYVSLCPELDIASQGNTVEEAKSNLKEAVALFFEHASENEVSKPALKYAKFWKSMNLFRSDRKEVTSSCKRN